jgi:hypothetical protein
LLLFRQFGKIGPSVIEPKEFQPCFCITDADFEHSSSGGVEAILPAEHHFPLYKDRDPFFRFAYGRDPSSIFVAKRNEKKEIQDSMDPFRGKKGGPFRSYPLDGGKRQVQMLSFLEICVFLARH